MSEKIPFVDLAAWHAPARDEYLAAFAQIIDTGAFVGGPQVADFERAFAAYCRAKHAVAVRTGTDALVLALRALGVVPGDEVIVPASSFFATAEAVSHAGATPVFADVDDATLLVDPDSVRALVTKRTRCIVPVHLFGQLADLARLRAFGVALLEDAAQAHGASRDGARAGSLGAAGAFSFYPTKNLGALGEGGCVTTHDEQLAARMRSLRDHGQLARHDHVEIGYNARLDSIQCACLAINLRRLDDANAARRTLAARYRDRLASVPGVRLIAEAPGEPVYHLFVVRVDARIRDDVRERMAAAGVGTAIHYPTPMHLQRAYAHLPRASCPVAERAAREVISLPMFPDLTVEQVDRVSIVLAESIEAALASK